jgi:ABC-2 type transport system permease protein
MTSPHDTLIRPATSPPTGPSASPDSTHMNWGGIAASELTKLRSVRSTWWTLASTVAMTVGFGALFCFAFVARFDHLDPVEKLTFDPTTHSLRGMFLAQIAIGVLGVLVVTNEYATGMIRNSFLAVPQRGALLAAKLAVFAAIAFVVSEFSAFVTFFVGQSILAGKHLGAGIGDPGVLRAVTGAGFYLTGIGILGLALGAILRRTSGAIATLVGIVLVLPVLAEALPSPWNTDVSKLLPGGAGDAFITVRHTPDLLSPFAGFALFVIYLVAALALAFFLISKRDA